MIIHFFKSQHSNSKIVILGAIVLLVIVAFLFLPLLINYQQLHTKNFTATPTPVLRDSNTMMVRINDKTIKARVAANDEDRERGLMFVQQMPEDEGMIFIFPEVKEVSFWMQNTYIPLDMIFVAEDGKIISIAENAEPLRTDKIYPSGGKVKYVIEVNGGYSGRNGLKVGDLVEL